jgi:hypothetical protein
VNIAMLQRALFFPLERSKDILDSCLSFLVAIAFNHAAA